MQAHSGIFRTLCNSGVFWTFSIFRTTSIFRTAKYPEPCQPSAMERFAKIVNDYNGFCNISFSIFLPCENNMYFLNTYLTFILEVFSRRKKVWGQSGPGAVSFWYTYSLMYSNKLTYFAASNSFGLPKQSLRKKSRSKLLKLLAKSLKITCKSFFLEPATLL